MVENRAIMYISCLGSCLVIGMASRRLGALGIPCNERLVDRLGNIGRYAANFRDLLARSPRANASSSQNGA